MTRTLIAGFGNVLRGDDGFGVAVLRRLGERGVASDSVELLDVGTGGIRMAQELITPYDRLIIIDAATRGEAPGTVYSLIVDGVQPTHEIDMHTTVPSRALEVAQAFGPLPAEVYLVGCEPLSVDELTTELSPVVAGAIDEAVRRVEALLRLMARGDVLLVTSRTAEYRLTETGRREAARRFAAEFAPLLSQGHGECSDPECDCHTSEGGAAECHARTHTHEPHGAH
ncbi:MAG: hydrogenase maturation protease [Gemmatimonadaceae bacterium]|nr:hydrogenase maturation protease [Gemmatimonadaceae bacterium]